MLTHPTLEQLRQLKLDGMADAFAEMNKQDEIADLSHAESLTLLVEREIASRNTQRFQTRMRSAKLRLIRADIKHVDFRTPRKLDQTQFQQLATGRWIDDARNLMITGPCGVGKTWLACARGQRACRDNLTVIYRRLLRLFDHLELAHGDGSFPRLFRSIVKANLLILDDLGPERLTTGQRRDLMEMVEDRHGLGSILITSQLPVTAWHPVIDEPTFADAILDRLVHNAHRFGLDGHSMRRSSSPAEYVDDTQRA